MAGFPGLIFDIGAHQGEDSDFYLKLGYRVVAVEANPVLAERLRERFSDEIRKSTFFLVERAISDTAGQITFYINKNKSVWGTADPEWAERNNNIGAISEKILVECVPFGDLISQYGCPEYVKIDIEGADMICVRALSAVDCRPKYLSVESTKTCWPDLIEEFNTLESLGYNRFKIARQGRHGKGVFDRPDGRSVSHSFDKHASGPFGIYLPGPWLTRAQALRRYRLIFMLYKATGDNSLLVRRLGHVEVIRRGLSFITAWYDTHAMTE